METGREFVKSNINVVLASRTQDKLEKAAKSLHIDNPDAKIETKI